MLCAAKIRMSLPDSHSVLLGEFSHTTVTALADIIEACAYGNEVYNYTVELSFYSRSCHNNVDTCGG